MHHVSHVMQCTCVILVKVFLPKTVQVQVALSDLLYTEFQKTGTLFVFAIILCVVHRY